MSDGVAGVASRVEAAPKAKEGATNTTDLVYLPIVPARASASARIERDFSKRGVYPIKGFIVHSRFPFGFIEQRRRLDASGEKVVYPAPLPLAIFAHPLPPHLGPLPTPPT